MTGLPGFPLLGTGPGAAFFPPSWVSGVCSPAGGAVGSSSGSEHVDGCCSSLITGGGGGHTLVLPVGVGPCLQRM